MWGAKDIPFLTPPGCTLCHIRPLLSLSASCRSWPLAWWSTCCPLGWMAPSSPLLSWPSSLIRRDNCGSWLTADHLAAGYLWVHRNGPVSAGSHWSGCWSFVLIFLISRSTTVSLFGIGVEAGCLFQVLSTKYFPKNGTFFFLSQLLCDGTLSLASRVQLKGL